ncbi:MAG: prenyltransferase/squalene oxidase repeat-containing protein, partial [Planctomycetota bacterium]
MARTDPTPTWRARVVELAPWLLVAALLHLVIFLALSLWRFHPGGQDQAVVPVTIVTGPNPFAAEVASPPEPPVTPLPDIKPAPQPNAEHVRHQEEVDTSAKKAPPEPDVSIADESSQPDVMPNGSSDALLAPRGKGSTMGPLANRRPGARERALQRYGGLPDGESAVAAGLAWLAAHQESDGSWDRLNFNRHCPSDDRCGGVAVRWTELDADPAVTALAALAFLGAGSSHRDGEHRYVVHAALAYLLDRQRANGSFSQPDRMEMYNDAIAVLMFAECYAMTGDDALLVPLQRGVDHLVRAQQPGGGWDYRSDLTTGRNDTSVTGWVTMALKASASASIGIPDHTVLGVVDHFLAATDAAGRVYYADRGTGTKSDPASGQITRRYGPAMSAVGMLSRQLLGWRPESQALADQAGLLLSELPEVKLLQGGDPTGLHSYYYWYHATLALFLRGGDDWQSWNPALREAVLALQDRSVSGAGQPRHVHGSWPALGPGWGKWGRTGSRVYSTALNVLTLETYYRYLPSYASAEPLIRARTLRLALRQRAGADRRRIVAIATQMPVEVAEPALVEALELPDPRARLAAAIGLAAMA